MNTTDMERGRNIVIDQLGSEEFQTYNICNVMDWIYTTFNTTYSDTTYEWETQKLKEFCNNFRLHLYERPRESFFKWEGIEEAQSGGYRGVILSDLS